MRVRLTTWPKPCQFCVDPEVDFNCCLIEKIWICGTKKPDLLTKSCYQSGFSICASAIKLSLVWRENSVRSFRVFSSSKSSSTAGWIGENLESIKTNIYFSLTVGAALHLFSQGLRESQAIFNCTFSHNSGSDLKFLFTFGFTASNDLRSHKLILTQEHIRIVCHCQGSNLELLFLFWAEKHHKLIYKKCLLVLLVRK